MAKEIKKFEERYKKLEKRRQACTESQLDKLFQQLKNLGSLSGQGEVAVMEEAVKARREGVTGDDIGPYMKHKGFKDMAGNLAKHANSIEEAVNMIKALDTEAVALSNELRDIYQDIASDLKSRKDSSASKTDIIKFQKSVEQEFERVAKLVGCFQKYVKPGDRDYGKNLPKTILTMILSSGKKTGENQLQSSEVDALLRGRKLAQNGVLSLTLRERVEAACAKAEEAAATDPKSSAPSMKDAGSAVTELARMVKTYQGLLKSEAKEIEKSMIKDKIHTTVKQMEKNLVLADKRLKEAMQVIRSKVN